MWAGQFVVSPLSGSLAATIGAAFNSLFLDATLTRDVEVTDSPDRESFDPADPTQTAYSCKAIVETYSQMFRRDGLVEANDRKVLILATSLAVTPKAGDRVTISGVTFMVMEVETDPAVAVWTCQGRF